jgi:hypothetical protein
VRPLCVLTVGAAAPDVVLHGLLRVARADVHRRVHQLVDVLVAVVMGENQDPVGVTRARDDNGSGWVCVCARARNVGTYVGWRTFSTSIGGVMVAWGQGTDS